MKKFLVGLALVGIAVTQQATIWEHLPPCEYEDSRNCVWDAQKSGNGTGTSFYDINGVQYQL